MILEDKIVNDYFEWLKFFTRDKRHIRYTKLLSFLHGIEFIYSVPHDENRAVDGVNLRWRFACEEGYKQDFDIIQRYLDEPCSVLEMMVALALRCEEHIMDDPEIGNRTSEWFWLMVSNLGLERMNDDKFNKKQAIKRIDIFLNREYGPNGEGGLFIVNNSRRDLREVEIWYQLCWYLNTIL